jgi:ATP-binding cassette subfamily F protein uup
MPEDQQVIGYLFDTDNELVKLIRDYEMLTLADHPDNEQLEQVIVRMDELQAWGFESKIKEILSRFGITRLNQKIAELSGGMRKKIALAKALIEEANLIILDEPTNHLDVVMIEWLENYLSRQNLSIFVVTHDRYFLDRVCNQILEMENGQLFQHKGNYAYFLKKKAERLANRQTEIDKAAGYVRKEAEWMRRMPKARTTKSKAKIDSFYEKEAISRSGKKEQEIKLEVKSRRIGGNILELEKVSKSYGETKILNNFNYLFKRGERIGIIGLWSTLNLPTLTLPLYSRAISSIRGERIWQGAHQSA